MPFSPRRLDQCQGHYCAGSTPGIPYTPNWTVLPVHSPTVGFLRVPSTDRLDSPWPISHLHLPCRLASEPVASVLDLLHTPLSICMSRYWRSPGRIHSVDLNEASWGVPEVARPRGRRLYPPRVSSINGSAPTERNAKSLPLKRFFCQ